MKDKEAVEKYYLTIVAGELRESLVIRVTLTPGNMMVPSKSITAIVGLADHPVMGRLATCGECVLREKCTLWRQGKHC